VLYNIRVILVETVSVIFISIHQIYDSVPDIGRWVKKNGIRCVR